MEETYTEALAKSEKISQKKKTKIVWLVAIVLLLVTMVSFVIEYSGYKKGQKYGLTVALTASEISSSGWVNQKDSYSEQCKSVYDKLNHRSYSYTLNGVKYDASTIQKTESALRSSFYNLMKKEGYDRYSDYNIADWFKYTNFVEYYVGCYWDNVLSIALYIVLLATGVFTFLVKQEEKKELVVYSDSVLCKVNAKKSKQLGFEDINNVDFGKNTLKIVGAGVKFKILNISNVEELKTLIINKKKAERTGAKNVNTSTNSADELKKYKELLDNGVISQEEFDAKKKQLLGL